MGAAYTAEELAVPYGDMTAAVVTADNPEAVPPPVQQVPDWVAKFADIKSLAKPEPFTGHTADWPN